MITNAHAQNKNNKRDKAFKNLKQPRTIHINIKLYAERRKINCLNVYLLNIKNGEIVKTKSFTRLNALMF